MSSEISGRIFEWLLADWAGFVRNPGDLFPSLRGMDRYQLAEELAECIHAARASQQKLKEPLEVFQEI